MSMPTRLFRAAFKAMLHEMLNREENPLSEDEIVYLLRQMRKQGPRFARNEILRNYSGSC